LQERPHVLCLVLHSIHFFLQEYFIIREIIFFKVKNVFNVHTFKKKVP